MPHRGTLFRDHKKNFTLIPVTSDPFFTFVYRASTPTPEQDEARNPGVNIPGANLGDLENIDFSNIGESVQSPIIIYGDINLAMVPTDVDRADNFRVGMNFIWRQGLFGVPEQFRVKYWGQRIGLQGSSQFSPSVIYKSDQFGYGLSVLGTSQGNLTNRVSIAELFRKTSTGFVPMGEPAPTARKSSSITGSLRTRQEFEISPAFGSDKTGITFAEVQGLDIPDWWTQDQQWTQHIKENIIGTFYDYAFNMEAPFPLDKIMQSYAGAGHVRDIYVDLKPLYNFHIPTYETAITTISSSLIPNMYVFASEQDEYFTDELNSRFKQHIEFGNLIPLIVFLRMC